MNGELIMKKIKTLVIFTGIYFYPCALLIAYIYWRVWEYAIAPPNPFINIPHIPTSTIPLIALIFPLIILMRNARDYVFRRKKEFTSFREYRKGELYSRERAIAMFPPIPHKYLSSKPNGIVIGKTMLYHLIPKYFRIDPHDPNMANHILINGNSGAGKSVMIITSLLSYFMGKKINQKQKKLSWVVIDTKPELAKICTCGDKDTVILNPAKPKKGGWNLYASINYDSPMDEIANVVKTIVEVIIVSDPKNEFFVDSARSLLEGGLIYEFYINHLTFMPAMEKILSSDLDEYVTNIQKDDRTPTKVLMLLAEYGKKENEKGQLKKDDSNAAADIKKQLKQKTDVFTREDVSLFLDATSNPIMYDASMVDQGISFFLSIKRSDLKYYRMVFLLIVSQIMDYLSQREDYDNNVPPCIMVLDEFHNLGSRIPNFTENLGYIRSKKVILITIIQQYHKLVALYGENEAQTIVNGSIDVLLTLEDTKLGEEFSKKAGEFEEVHKTYNSANNSHTYSTKKEKVLRNMQDFSSLVPRSEVAIFIDGKYYRMNKVKYYKNKKLKKQAEENKQIYKEIY